MEGDERREQEGGIVVREEAGISRGRREFVYGLV